MEKGIRIGLWVLVIVLGYSLYSVIMNPIRFSKENNRRSADVIQRLKEVRKAQIAFKEVNNFYASSFDELIPLLDTGVFTIVQRRDEELKFYNKVYREYQLKDTTYIDTLGFASIKDSVFGSEFNLEKLRFIPHTDGSELQLRANKIKSGSLTVQVFEAKATKEEYLKGLDKDLIKNTAKDLQVGSMTSAKINGNWE
ncbi:MAG: hypothetical protein QNK65_03985 [Flavobacteriales bacterium]|jgi:hypothetical protein|tara:strand:- start:981 stop:1571 length:591 start_codon:yes stop_codon:yes gene_type:complete